MTLRDIAARRSAVLAPGAANALFARIIEDLGYECVYVTGAGIANMALGAPDIGLTTLDDIAQTVSRIADAVSLPLIVDAGIGRPSHATAVMELGYDAVLLNTAVASAGDPADMAEAFAKAIDAGHIAHQAGMLEPRDMAVPSTPVIGKGVFA